MDFIRGHKALTAVVIIVSVLIILLFQSQNDYEKIPETIGLYKKWGRVFCMANGYKNISANIADIKTFEGIGYPFAKDKYNIYSYSNICTMGVPSSCYCGIEKSGHDQASFKVLDMGGVSIKDKTGVYYLGQKLEGIDPETYEILKYNSGYNSDYSKDKNGVYFRSKKIEIADIASFRSTGESKAEDINGTYLGMTFYAKE